MQAVSDSVNLFELGPREGLQHESRKLPLNDKVELVQKLLEAGLDQIEVGGFFSHNQYPQIADTDQLFPALGKNRAFSFSALVVDESSMQRALAVDVKSIGLVIATSESYSRKHFGCSIDELFERLKPVMELASENNIDVRGYLSCVFGCPYEGRVSMTSTINIAEKLYNFGCYEVSLADTLGIGTPNQAQTLILHAAGVIPLNKIAIHFHDTRGQALANILACLEMGVSTIDTSVSGLGECQHANSATANVATEDVVYMLHGLGIECGVDLDKIIEVGQWVSNKLNRRNNSRVGRTGVPAWILES